MPAGSASSARASSLGQQRQEFEEQRQKVGQLAGGRLKAMAAIECDKIGHRLAAVAAFAVHMLEQMQRQRAAAIEQ